MLSAVFVEVLSEFNMLIILFDKKLLLDIVLENGFNSLTSELLVDVFFDIVKKLSLFKLSKLGKIVQV